MQILSSVELQAMLSLEACRPGAARLPVISIIISCCSYNARDNQPWNHIFKIIIIYASPTASAIKVSAARAPYTHLSLLATTERQRQVIC